MKNLLPEINQSKRAVDNSYGYNNQQKQQPDIRMGRTHAIIQQGRSMASVPELFGHDGLEYKKWSVQKYKKEKFCRVMVYMFMFVYIPT